MVSTACQEVDNRNSFVTSLNTQVRVGKPLWRWRWSWRWSATLVSPEHGFAFKTETGDVLNGTEATRITTRLEICQKIYMTGFFGQKFYTIKVRKLRRFLLKKKQHECTNISYFSLFLLDFNWVCILFTDQCKITLGVCKSCSFTQIMREIALFSGRIYTPETNFTPPPVVMVASNLNSACAHSLTG